MYEDSCSQPAVPGAQYRITAWALDGSNRSATLEVEYATAGEAGECSSDPPQCLATNDP